MYPNDVDGDGRSEIVVSSPWGIGVLGIDGGTLRSQMLRPNGSRIGRWLLQARENEFGPIADFCGVGKAQVLVKSGWGIGLLHLDAASGTSSLMAQNGTRIGAWLLNTDNDDFGPFGDFDGDGIAEVIVTSGWGLGILKKSGDAFGAPFMAANGTKLGDWMLNAPENRFGPIGDFDGDGQDEILVQSLWGIGVLKWVNGALKSIAMLPNATSLGRWKLDVQSCRFLAVGNFEPGKTAQILAVDAGGITILKLVGGQFSVVSRAVNGDRCGSWKVNSESDRFGPAADFDGDGVSEILVTSNWGMGVLKLSGTALTSVAMASNGTRLGEWLLDTRGNRLNRVGHYSGSGKAEILASSGWGAGVLQISGDGFSSITIAPNQTALGDWRLNTADNDLEHGNQKLHAVVIYHPDWGSSVNHTVLAMRRRGYTVNLADSADIGLNILKLLSLNLKAGDRVFVYLAGHGLAVRGPGDFTQLTSERHRIYFHSGSLSLGELFPIFTSLANRCVDLTVFDGSCEGGETVHQASGQRYCAMATTGLWSPAYVNTPDPSAATDSDSKPGRFGLWWNPSHVTGSQINGQVISQILAQGPHRLHQRLHRNDTSPLARTALLARSAICNLMMPGWNYVLDGWGCYLYKYFKDDLTDEQEARLTTSADDYIRQLDAITAPQAVLLKDYKRHLANTGVIHEAAFVYAAHFDAAWRTLAEDSDWDVRGNPGKHRERMYDVFPDAFRPEEGFKKLAAQALNTILLSEHLYHRQIALLRQMDDELKRRWQLEKVPSPTFKPKVFPEKRWEDYLERNRADRAEARRFQTNVETHRFLPAVTSELLEIQPSGHEVETLALASPILERMAIHTRASTRHIGNLSKVKQLADEVNATFTQQYWLIARLNILLGLVEDAIVAVHSSSSASPSDLVAY